MIQLPLRLQQTFAVLTTLVVRAAFVFGALGTITMTSRAQQAASGKGGAFSVEANPFRGSFGYARVKSTRWELGASIGFGIPQIDQTLFRGKRDDFRDYAHIGAFARRHYGTRAVLELGARLGIAEYQRCDASDCWPKVYFGRSILFAVGGEHVKIGPRLTISEISHPSGDLDVFASVSPVNVLISWRWE